ncbi:MAG: hypothetical protein V1871_03855 [Planctomycetota bacterium]
MTLKEQGNPIILKILGILILIGGVLFAMGAFLIRGKDPHVHPLPPFHLLGAYFIICGIGIIALRKWAIIAFTVPVTCFDILFITTTGMLLHALDNLFNFILLLIFLIPLGVVSVLFLNWKKCKW